VQDYLIPRKENITVTLRLPLVKKEAKIHSSKAFVEKLICSSLKLYYVYYVSRIFSGLGYKNCLLAS
jgi:hypothetical protein